MKKVLVINDICDCGFSYGKPFTQFGEITHDLKLLDDPKSDIALCVFSGGADVSPELYFEKPNSKTYSNKKRDLMEKAIFDRIQILGIPVVGICRGAQFLCVMSGGKLIQHVTNHHSPHEIEIDDDEGTTFKVSSVHHQMQMPQSSAYIFGWSKEKLSDRYEGPPGIEYKNIDKEPEIVWYPKIKSLGIQFHPECMGVESKGFQIAGDLVKQFFGLSEVASGTKEKILV